MKSLSKLYPVSEDYPWAFEEKKLFEWKIRRGRVKLVRIQGDRSKTRISMKGRGVNEKNIKQNPGRQLQLFLETAQKKVAIY